MARKNKTLPKDFEEIVQRGDLDELKAVFKKCEINAHERYGSDTALFFRGLTPEFVRWFVEQGGDIHYCNNFGYTPLGRQSCFTSNEKDNEIYKKFFEQGLQIHYDNSEIIELLIELGAEVNTNTSSTPLILACRSLNPTAVKILLKHGADPIGSDKGFNSPLTEALYQFAPIPETLEIAKLLLSLGVPITEQMKEYVGVMGKRFEDKKLNPTLSEYSKYIIERNESIMNELYRLFGVEPIKPRQLYDGHSQIIVPDNDDLQATFKQLWDFLVLPTGQCSTVQGEVIRITGRIAGEIYRNGGMNWKADYQKMLNALINYFKMGYPLNNEQLNQAEYLKAKVYQGNPNSYDEAVELSNLAVLWVKANPNPIMINQTDYEF
ncbi:ankyrin repeat domain-containing protein [Moraxella nasibovis]|uniref:ankyrin repeat domain-containing protein n=1 Tax=Moraxella nasibovis TaxID=2904120 RepID=UPI00241065F7|nr:ankyrin repeat domain-containing protein [Moraxella nasibovis]WFF37973.1 ankyrin repeat domain-containing protein [Moraxella nasibovis]